MGTNHEDTHINESILSEEILEDQKKNRIDHMTYLPGMEDIGSEILDQVVTAMEAYDYNTYTAEDVKRALAHAERTPEDFQALLSPAALPFLEEIAQAAQIETRKHFGNSVYMFTPIYIANYCENYCIYCGFNCHNKINRAQLNAEEIEKEMAAIAETGLQEILILTGESRNKSTVARRVMCISLTRPVRMEKLDFRQQILSGKHTWDSMQILKKRIQWIQVHILGQRSKVKQERKAKKEISL